MDNVAGDPGPPHDRQMDARVTVLEEIAATLKEAVGDFRQELRAQRTETMRRDDDLRSELVRRTDVLRDAQERDFRILFSATITISLGLAALMAKGFHWF